MFTRQVPKVAMHYVFPVIEPMCPGRKPEITASYFSSSNDGPFYRQIDPTIDLVEVDAAQKRLTYPNKVWNALLDRAPSGHEFILSNIGSADLSDLPPGAMDNEDMLVIVDRISCLQSDPIRIHNRAFNLHIHKSPTRNLLIRACVDPLLKECKERLIEVGGQPIHLPAIRTLLIGTFSLV